MGLCADWGECNALGDSAATAAATAIDGQCQGFVPSPAPLGGESH